MSSNAFSGQGRRLGSSSESNAVVRTNLNVNGKNGLWPNDQATRSPLDPVAETLVPLNSDRDIRQGSIASTASTASLTAMARDPSESGSKKRKRRASTASTASLPRSTSIKPDMEVHPVQKRFKGEEIIDLLTDEDRMQWNKWLEQQTDQLDPLESLEVWYHDVRNLNLIDPSKRKVTKGRSIQTTVYESIEAPSKGTILTTNSLSNSTPEDSLPQLVSIVNIKGTSDATPGGFRYPTVLKTWCFGYPRARDIKLEEVLQRNHLSSVVISSFVWDLDFWWSKINRDSTPCQFVMERDQLQPGTRLHDGPHRIILHPEKTKILHSKFMLLFFEEAEELRLVITSANMMGFDWGEMGGFMENIVFLIDLPKISTKRDQDLTQFGTDFSEYCTSLGLTSNIVNQLKNYDWEGTRDLIFIATHGRVSQEELPYTGLVGLSQKLAQAGLTHDGELEIDYVSSSIGRLNWEFLSYLYQACKGQQPLPTPAKCKNKTNPDELLNNIRIYFASQATAEASKGGPMNAGKNLCYYPNNYYSLGEEKNVLYDCKSQRPGCLMHNKILFVRPKEPGLSGSSATQESTNAGPDSWFKRANWQSTTVVPTDGKKSADDESTAYTLENSAALSTRQSPTPWVYVGSANCSWAAWCNPRYCKKQDDGYNTGSNWECGVIIPVRVLQPGHGTGRLDIFSSILPIPMHTDTERLHPQSRRPFFEPVPQAQPPEGLT